MTVTLPDPPDVIVRNWMKLQWREYKSEFCFLNVLNSQALQADGMEDFVDKPQTERCRPYGCGEYIITENGRMTENRDGECQKQQPAAGTYWYAMQSQKLCQRGSGRGLSNPAGASYPNASQSGAEPVRLRQEANATRKDSPTWNADKVETYARK